MICLSKPCLKCKVSELNKWNSLTAPVEFTDEEGYGKYLDLHECYEKYINLKGIEVNIIILYLEGIHVFILWVT